MENLTNEHDESLQDVESLQDKDFTEGFDLGEEDEGDGGDGDNQPFEEAAEDKEILPEDSGAPAPVEYSPAPAYVPPAAVVAPAKADVSPAPEVRQIEALPEHIQDEYESLKKISPRAAELALEDSKEGAEVRRRLESLHAESAMDYGEIVIDRRERDAAAQQAALQQQRQEVEQHNNYFMATLQKELPDYAAMRTTPARQAEFTTYLSNVRTWIGTKPYAEGARLMEIFDRGINPNEVVGLLKQYESERGKGVPKRPDPTGALAVPARGLPVAPAGVGDKDDYDAGWKID